MKDRNFTAQIGTYIDGLKISATKKKIYSEFDETSVEVQRSLFDSWKKVFSHSN
jgi:hypothetical protein